MPIYDYACECGEKTEDVRPYSKREEPGPTCTTCGAETSYRFSGAKVQTFALKNLWGGAKKHNIGEI